MKKTVLFVPLFILTACAGVKTAHVEPDGDQAYKLSCNEFNLSLEECKAQVSQYCPNGYHLVEHREDKHPDPGDGFYWPSTHHLRVKCS
jgi:ribulose bisphosphate carboxylase small subunit